MLEIVNKKTGEVIIFPTPDHSKPAPIIDSLPDNEFCVGCGRFTDVPINLHIDFRKNYIENAGQLCQDCYDEIYTIKDKDGKFLASD